MSAPSAETSASGEASVARAPALPTSASVPLASASGSPADGGPLAGDSLSITVDAAGRVTVGDQPIQRDEELTAAARTFLAAHPGGGATIAADVSATHGRIVALVDRLREGGIQKVAFLVAPSR